MKATIHYYAILREQRGLDVETVEVDSADLRQLYRRLRDAFAFSPAEGDVRPAVNDEFCDWARPIADGDLIVFVPPVAGG